MTNILLDIIENKPLENDYHKLSEHKNTDGNDEFISKTKKSIKGQEVENNKKDTAECEGII